MIGQVETQPNTEPDTLYSETMWKLMLSVVANVFLLSFWKHIFPFQSAAKFCTSILPHYEANCNSFPI